MKRPARNADEQDCFYARKYYNYFKKPGRASSIKRRARRRERRNSKIDLTKQTDTITNTNTENQ